VRLGYPEHYSATWPVYGSWIVLGHDAALPRPRVLLVEAQAGAVGGGGWAGTHLRLRGVVAYGLRTDD